MGDKNTTLNVIKTTMFWGMLSPKVGKEIFHSILFSFFPLTFSFKKKNNGTVCPQNFHKFLSVS